jgi:hypothetical protein
MKNTYRSIGNLASIPFPAPTKSYTPVPQEDLWKLTVQLFENRGYTISKESHVVHHSKPIFVSNMTISKPTIMNPEMEWTCALVNSYNMTRPASILFGGRVFACSNGLMVADHILKTKHTTHVWDRLPGMVATAVNSFEEEVTNASIFYNSLRQQFTNEQQLSTFAVNLGRVGLLPKSSVVDFVDEAINPSFDYDSNKMCLWNVHNAYTHLAKEFTITERPQRVMNFEKSLKAAYLLA